MYWNHLISTLIYIYLKIWYSVANEGFKCITDASLTLPCDETLLPFSCLFTQNINAFALQLQQQINKSFNNYLVFEMTEKTLKIKIAISKAQVNAIKGWLKAQNNKRFCVYHK